MRHRRPLPEPVLRRLADRATDYGLSRRAFLGLLGAAGGASVLAGCGIAEEPVSYRGQGGRPGYLRWASYPLYIDKDDDDVESPTLTEFEAKTGIHVLYHETIDNLAKFDNKVSGRLASYQDIGYDLVTLSDWLVKRWSDRAHVAPLDLAAMPNTQNLRPDLDNLYYDPDHRCSVPWQQGITVVAWNKEAVPDGIRSVNDLWRPEFKGKVAVVAELRETLGPIMRSLGTDPGEDWGDAEFDAALELLDQQITDGQIMSIKGGDMVDLLHEGRAAVGIGYGGDVAFYSDTCGWAVPEEGATFWVDNLVAPVTTNQVDSVQQLIDFYYDPEVAAAVSAYTYYATPVAGAREAMKDVDPDLVDDDMIFLTDEMLARLSLFRELSVEEAAQYDTRFRDVTKNL
ncbi:MAG: spermidine/putrescine ABC transporter substrate-binding protein [Micrococcales bacterium]|nr:spermidine/putrescine ABC transporter substrate-binding protein [Micrococcales bacterium]